MSNRPTIASEAFRAWWKTLRNPSKRAVARQCGVTFTALSHWAITNTRPMAHCRTILEILSGGKVREDDWLFPFERQLIAAARPIDSATPASLPRTGTDDA